MTKEDRTESDDELLRESEESRTRLIALTSRLREFVRALEDEVRQDEGETFR